MLGYQAFTDIQGDDVHALTSAVMGEVDRILSGDGDMMGMHKPGGWPEVSGDMDGDMGYSLAGDVDGDWMYGDVDGDLYGDVDGDMGYDMMGAPRRHWRGRQPQGRGRGPQRGRGAPPIVQQNRRLAQQNVQMKATLNQMKQAMQTARMAQAPYAPKGTVCGVEMKGPCGPSRAVFPIGFDSGTPVAPGATVNVITQPQMPFQPYKLIIPANLGVSFALRNISVGTRSQFVATGRIPCIAFSETATDVLVKFDPVQVAQNIVLQVENISPGAVLFLAAMIGRACA